VIPTKVGKFSIRKGRARKRGRYCFYGPGSGGKTTLACSAPGALTMSMEDGARELDVACVRFDEKTDRVHPLSFGEVLDGLAEVAKLAPGDIETFVLDGTHVLDALIQAEVCRVNGWPSIAEPGYGKGERECMALLRQVFARLDDINSRLNIRIILTGHDKVATFKNPEAAEYGHYDLAMVKNKETDLPGFVYGWCDVYGFLRFETLTEEIGKKEKARTVAVAVQGARVMHLQRTTAYVAKCRYGGPANLALTHDDGTPCTWSELFADLEDKAPERLRAEIERLIPDADAATGGVVKAWLAKVGDDPNALTQGLENLRKKIATKEVTA
jgi:hypothetical protein